MGGMEGQSGRTTQALKRPWLFFFLMYLFIWLHGVLVVVHRIFSCGHVGSSSLTRE